MREEKNGQVDDGGARHVLFLDRYLSVLESLLDTSTDSYASHTIIDQVAYARSLFVLSFYFFALNVNFLEMAPRSDGGTRLEILQHLKPKATTFDGFDLAIESAQIYIEEDGHFEYPHLVQLT